MLDAGQLLGSDVGKVILALQEKMICKIPNNCQYPLKCITDIVPTWGPPKSSNTLSLPQMIICRFCVQNINDQVKRSVITTWVVFWWRKSCSCNTEYNFISLCWENGLSASTKIVLQVFLWAETLDARGRNQTAPVLDLERALSSSSLMRKRIFVFC